MTVDQLNSIFSERWGCNFPRVAQLDNSSYEFQIRPSSDSGVEFDGSIQNLRLRFNGRWGNYVFQLINMFHLAEKLGCTRLFIHSSEIFPISEPRCLHGLTIDSVRSPHHGDGFELESVFFDIRAFGNLILDLTPDRRRELALKYVRPLLTGHLASKASFVGKGDLIIHIRSGDIFQGIEGQGGSQVGGSLYIQPPLAFYTTVARAALHRGVAHAIVISENSLNPTILPLIERLQEMGYAVSVRLQHDLISDLSYLFAARHAVFANGTIGIAVALLSESITDGYFFRKDGTGTTFDVDHYLGSFLNKHYIIDEDGAFIRKGEWENTQEQRDLMVSLPTERLHWERYPKVVNIALGKPARQSSISVYSQPDESARAVNGMLDGDFSFHTNQEHFPWWEVDLGAYHRIEQITIYNRVSYPERAYNMQVYLLDREQQWILVHDQGGKAFGGPGGKPARIVLGDIEGRVVRVQLPAYGYLHLSEIEVYSLV